MLVTMYNDHASYLWLDTAISMLGIQGEGDPIYAYSPIATTVYKMNQLILTTTFATATTPLVI